MSSLEESFKSTNKLTSGDKPSSRSNTVFAVANAGGGFVDLTGLGRTKDPETGEILRP